MDEGLKLPVINVHPFTSPNPNEKVQRECAQNMMKAASEQGFFYLVGHGISNELLEEALEWSNRFFSLPLRVKQEIDVTKSRSLRGYQPLRVNVTKGRRDKHEGIDLYRDTEEPQEDYQGPTNMGLNQWLDEDKYPEIKGFRQFWEDSYVPAMRDLGSRVMAALSMGLDLPTDYFSEFYDKSFWQMRILRYPRVHPDDLQPGELGVGEHTDYGCVTLLLTDETRNCLQVRDMDGQWVNVQPVFIDNERALVVNLGDMLEKWTGGRLRATPHRVLSPMTSSEGTPPIMTSSAENAYRLSIPFFFEPNYEAVIKPIFTDEKSKKMKAVMYGDHLMSKTSKNFSFQKGTLLED